jgi:uncharacterized protein (TIGR02569 family)
MNHKNSSPPPPHILTAFNLNIQDEPVALPGGIHGAFRAGPVVLKHVDDPHAYKWICENILSLQIAGVRLQQPMRTSDGCWIKDGWSAYQYLTGSTVEGSLQRKLEVARKLHHGLKAINNPPPFLIQRYDPWGCAERMIWGEEQLPQTLSASIQEKLTSLIDLNQALEKTSQIVHVDLCGNIIFDSGLEPAIIDLSLTFRPALFAEAVLIYDAVVWEGGNINEVASWTAIKENKNFLKKATAFRLLVTVLIGEKSRAENLFFAEFDRANELLGAALRN